MQRARSTYVAIGMPWQPWRQSTHRNYFYCKRYMRLALARG
jgi:hypothetical protein